MENKRKKLTYRKTLEPHTMYIQDTYLKYAEKIR